MQTEVLEVVKAAKELVDLIGAEVIVSVGRGIGKDVRRLASSWPRSWPRPWAAA